MELPVFDTVPNLPTILLVDLIPFQNMTQSSFWKSPLHYSCVDVYGYFVAAVLRMEVGRTMIIPVHSDDDSEEAAYYGHSLTMFV